MKFGGLLLFIALPALAGEPKIPCTIIDCPEKYMPPPPTGKPDAEAMRKVNAAFAEKNRVTLLEAAARTKWKKARLKIQSLTAETPAAERTEKIKDYVAKAGALHDAIAEKRKAHDNAIWETAIAYKIVPPEIDLRGDERLGDPWRRVNSWNPQFGQDEIWDKKLKKWRPRDEDDLRKKREDNARKAAGLNMGAVLGTADAHTSPMDGSIQIFDDAFDSPEKLAATIYHETSHWIDAVNSHGKHQSPPERWESEQMAYDRQADFLDKIGLSGEADRNVARQFAWQADYFRRNRLNENDIRVKPEYRNWLQGSFHGGESGRPEPARERAEDQFYKDIAEGKDVASHAREIGIELMHQEDRRRLFDGLMFLARIACSSPDMVYQPRIDELPALPVLTDYDLAPDYSHLGLKEDSCASRSYRAMVARLRDGGRLTEAWVVQLGRRVMDDFQREADEAERKKKEEEALAALEALAAEYSFEVDDIRRDGEIIFRDTGKDPRFGRAYGFNFKFLNEVRAGLFLARACIEGKVRNSGDNALKTLRRNAADVGFHYKLLPTYSDPVYDCIRALVEYPDSLGDARQIEKILGWHRSRVEKAEKDLRRQEELNRQARERQQRERRPRDSDDVEETRRGNLDLSPAERALERARDSAGRGLRR